MPWSLAEDLDQPFIFDPIVDKPQAQRLAIVVSEMLRQDGRSREELADDLSTLLGEKISKLMLDAYASKARREHPIPAHRFLGLAFLTGRWNLVDALLQPFDVRIATKQDERLVRLGDAVRGRDYLNRVIEQELRRDQ